MQAPKMIIFDYGNTLIFEKELNFERAYAALYACISKNPLRISFDEFYRKGTLIFENIKNKALKHDIEIHTHNFYNAFFQSLDIEFDMPYTELESVFWEALAPCVPMPNIEKLLLHLDKNNIRSAVISNISFSKEALTNRIHTYIPENNFEFILASSEYGFRKPESILFEIALRKAKLKADEVWYCGDNKRADIIGSAAAGLTPILFSAEWECPYHNDYDARPQFAFLIIKNWEELIEFL